MAATTDPITTEVIRNALNSAAEEMNATLFRSAYTWIIYELRDCSVALLDAEHRVLGQSSGLPIFLGNLEVCTKLTEETYGREAWEPGDVWALNDSYLAGTHLNDVTVFSPIFHDGALIGFGASRAHWLDVGAKEDIYSLMREVAAKGAAILFVSDNLPELIGLSNRIIVLRDGVVSAVVNAPKEAKPREVDVVAAMV